MKLVFFVCNKIEVKDEFLLIKGKPKKRNTKIGKQFKL